MKLKYQMRGLGIGIMVTALLMGVAMEKGLPLSDAEIKAKALELGMVERESLKLTDLQGESPAPGGTSSPGEGDVASDGTGSEGTGEADIDSGATGSGASPGADGSGEADAGSGAAVPGESGASPGADGSGEADAGSGAAVPGESGGGPGANSPGESGSVQGAQPDGNGGSQAKEAVTVVIEFGMASAHVSELLEEAGLVEDASVFDAYLCNNGYSRRITAGVYEIQQGASEEEIIEIITKNR